jgi:hypothetical protein
MTLALRSLVLAATLLVHPLSRADAVSDWSRIALDTVVQSEQRLEYQLRAMAMVHVAMFETLNLIEGRYTPHFVVSSPKLRGISIEAAAAAAAHHVLGHLYPHQSAPLAAALDTSLHALADHQAVASGVVTGTSIAAVICALRATDERINESSIAQRNVALPRRAPTPGLELWLPKRADQFRPKDSVAVQATLWTRDADDANPLVVRGSGIRADLETEGGRVWSLPSPLSWSPLVAELIAIRGLSPLDSARIHALASMAIADVYGATRDAQYPCAPCVAVAAMAAILASEFGAGGNDSKTINVDQELGRQIGRYAFQHYFRPLAEPGE